MIVVNASFQGDISPQKIGNYKITVWQIKISGLGTIVCFQVIYVVQSESFSITQAFEKIIVEFLIELRFLIFEYASAISCSEGNFMKFFCAIFQIQVHVPNVQLKPFTEIPVLGGRTDYLIWPEQEEWRARSLKFIFPKRQKQGVFMQLMSRGEGLSGN